MDKEEFRQKLDKINNLVDEKNYSAALDVVDSIDWQRVKNIRTLCVVGEIYAANKRYEDSKRIFELAYHRSPIGKNILYRLIEISLRLNDINSAFEYYKKFKEVSPNDSTQYVLLYKILKAKNAPIEEQIQVLEIYKDKEFTEKWGYELAKLYYEDGEKEKCINLCDEIILWFSEGNYVTKSLELKMRLGAITEKEKEQYEESFRPNLTPIINDDNSDDDKTEIKHENITKVDETDFRGVENLQERVSRSIRDIIGGKKEESEIDSSKEELIKNSSEVENSNLSDNENKTEVVEDNVPTPIIEKEDDLEKSKETIIKKDSKSIENLEEVVNLEDSLIDAIKDVGIDISDENKKIEPVLEVPFDKDESLKKEANIKLEEEEFLSEEDLSKAEKEFLEGPEQLEEKNEEPIKSELFDDYEFNVNIEDIEMEPKEPINTDEELSKIVDEIKEEKTVKTREMELTDYEKKLFNFFVKIPGMKDQFIYTLTDVLGSSMDNTSKSGNVIVMGGPESGKTTIIGSLIPAICKELDLEASRVAYVFADDINNKDLSVIVEKLYGGFFVIEDANKLNKETADQLNELMEKNTGGMTIILEDEKISMRKFMAKNPKLMEKFTSIINIPVFTNDELVHFAQVYALQRGCKIDQMGMLSLYNLINMNQKQDEPITIGTVKNIIDNAVSRINGKIFKKKKRYDADGYLILQEKDFSK